MTIFSFFRNFFSKKKFNSTFLKSQIASISATILDFSLVFLLTEWVHFHYSISVACGAFCGAVLNFMMGRFWAFNADKMPIASQMTKYGMVSFGSLLLNVFGVTSLTEFFHLHYGVSKGITALLVGVGFNYPLQKFFVFSKQDEGTS